MMPLIFTLLIYRLLKISSSYYSANEPSKAFLEKSRYNGEVIGIEGRLEKPLAAKSLSSRMHASQISNELQK